MVDENRSYLLERHASALLEERVGHFDRIGGYASAAAAPLPTLSSPSTKRMAGIESLSLSSVKIMQTPSLRNASAGS